jgi:hypothetical protein
MTDPTDETQPHQTPGAVPPAPNPADATTPAAAGSAPASAPGTPGGATPQPAAPDAGTTGATGTATPPPQSPPLRANPDRPPTAWREPPWIPPAPARRSGPSPIAIVIGLIILAVGLYYFIDRTLGIDLPAVSWGNFWPVILIVIGGLILLRAWERGR